MSDNVVNFSREVPQEMFSGLFETAPIKMHAIGPTGILLDVSTVWAEALGYTREEMIGRRSTEFLTEESRKYALDVVLPKFFRNGHTQDIEYDFVRKDGSLMPILMSATARYDNNGNFLHSLAVIFDNSEAKSAQARLGEQYRIEAVGRLVSGVAHDFNNILMVIKGNLEFLEDDIDADARRTFLTEALGAVERGTHLSRQLLSYGRKSDLTPKKVDLNEVVRDAENMLHRLVPDNITIETTTFSGLWSTHLDRGQLETVLLNLVSNAKDAMPSGGLLSIETANVTISTDYVVVGPDEIDPGPYVMLAVSDQGEGMADEVLDHAFEPFFTTKAVGAGSGLGLSLVNAFVRQSRGTVKILSELGFGTTVKMYFPAVEAAKNDPQQNIAGGPDNVDLSAEILVVEGDDTLRRLVVRQLSERGLKTAEARSGDAAIALMEQGFSPKIIISDLMMTGKVQGPEFGRQARNLRDDVQMIYMSGYPREEIQSLGLIEKDVCLDKPVDRKKLLSTVRKLLDR